VQRQPKEELHTRGKDALLMDIKVSLSGYAAEKIKYGTTSSGVASDFTNLMQVAHTMVWSLGMGDEGFLGDYAAIPDDIRGNQLSESIKESLNMQTQKIIQRCEKETEEILKKEWTIVERFVKELLEKEELDYDEIDAIFKEFGKEHVKVTDGKA